MANLDALHQPYWTTMGPMIIMTATAFLVMILEFVFRKGDKRWLIVLSMVGVAAALVVAMRHFYQPFAITMTTVVIDGFAAVFTVLILISAFLVLLFALDYTGKVKLPAEHTYLILFAAVGAISMATAVDLVSLYIGLELLSVASYVLVAIRRKSVHSVEGGIKYMIMGSIGSAVLLYGMSFLYGISGSTNLGEIGSKGFEMFSKYPAVTVLAFTLILCGLGFKLSVVPFHMWTPDAYDGAPSPVSAFIATLSKAASFIMLLRILLFAFFATASDLFYIVAILSAATMIVGNIIALPQRNMKRLLAFSSVAQAGYVLVPFALIKSGHTDQWIGIFNGISFYLFAYTFMTIGAFAVVSVVARSRNTIDSDALIGLYQRSPWLAVALTVFALSLAGMPLTGGFLGKFYIFTDTMQVHEAWLGVLLFATSVVSFFYYLGWIRKIFQKEPVAEVQPIRAGGVMNTLVGLCVAGTLVLGIVPAALLHFLTNTPWLYSG